MTENFSGDQDVVQATEGPVPGAPVPASPEETSDVVPSSSHVPSSAPSNIRSSLERFADSISTDEEKASSIRHDLRQAFEGMCTELEQRYPDYQGHMKFEEDVALMSEIQVMASKILLQTLEQHEYTIPRLFIVLPMPIGLEDIPETPSRQHFRLFFLCEGCGCIMTDGRCHPNEIHLAKHKGYSLKRPMEFFDKYASYVLRLLRIVKHGINFGDMFVTPLARLCLPENLENLKGDLNLANNITDLVEKAITLLEEKAKLDIGEHDDHMDVDVHESLRVADLWQLKSFLDMSDEDNSLGGLCRIITGEGHVKWVCSDYYQRKFGEHGKEWMDRLKTHVQERNGTLDMHLRRAEVKIESKNDASRFNEVLAKSKGLVELSVCVDWDATQDELQALMLVVSRAEITYLTIDGSKIQQRLNGVVHWGRRFNPILDLLSRKHIRSLTLIGFKDFYQRTNINISKYPNLRVLSVDSRVHDTSSGSKFSKFILSCPDLVKLTLKCDELLKVFIFFDENIPRFQKLETLTLENRDLSIVISLFDNEMFAKLTVNRDPSVEVRNTLEALVKRRNSRLTELDMVAPLSSYESLLSRLTGAARSPAPSRIVLSNEETAPTDCLVVVTLIPGSDSCDITTDIQMLPNGGNEHLSMHSQQSSSSTTRRTLSRDRFSRLSQHSSGSSTRGTPSDHFSMLFEDYGHTIQRLVTSERLRDDHLKLLAEVVQREGSKITHLVLDSNSLGVANRDAVEMIIRQSTNMEYLHLEFKEFHKMAQRQLARHLLTTHGSRVTELSLGGQPLATWVHNEEMILEMQKNLTSVDTFRLICDSRQELSNHHARLIAAVVSRPPEAGSNGNSDGPSAGEFVQEIEGGVTASSNHLSTNGLKVLYLEYVSFEPNSWELILEALNPRVLESLSFKDSNFDLPQLKLLLKLFELIPADNSCMSFKKLDLKDSQLARQELSGDGQATLELVNALKERSRHLKVNGLTQ